MLVVFTLSVYMFDGKRFPLATSASRTFCTLLWRLTLFWLANFVRHFFQIVCSPVALGTGFRTKVHHRKFVCEFVMILKGFCSVEFARLCSSSDISVFACSFLLFFFLMIAGFWIMGLQDNSAKNSKPGSLQAVHGVKWHNLRGLQALRTALHFALACGQLAVLLGARACD